MGLKPKLMDAYLSLSRASQQFHHWMITWWTDVIWEHFAKHCRRLFLGNPAMGDPWQGGAWRWDGSAYNTATCRATAWFRRDRPDRRYAWAYVVAPNVPNFDAKMAKLKITCMHHMCCLARWTSFWIGAFVSVFQVTSVVSVWSPCQWSPSSVDFCCISSELNAILCAVWQYEQGQCHCLRCVIQYTTAAAAVLQSRYVHS